MNTDSKCFLAGVFAIVLIVGARAFVRWVRQKACDHEACYRDSHDHAICEFCSKDLGHYVVHEHDGSYGA